MKSFTIRTTRFRFTLAVILIAAGSWIGTFLLVSGPLTSS